MASWDIHICNSRHRLDVALSVILDALEHAERACAEIHKPIRLDLTVRATDWPMPEPLQVSGSAFGPARIDLGVDMSRQVSDDNLHQSVLRTVLHEFHHVLRWDRLGYGLTLGEALASEGLAQAFVHEVMDCPPEPWEQAIDGEQLAAISQEARREFEASEYDHGEWFFGAGQFPNWSGYSVGHQMVARYLAERNDATALGCAALPAKTFKPFLS